MALTSLLMMMALLDGEKLYQQRNFAAAEVELRRTLARHPADSRSRLLLARTLVELNRVPEALVEIERTLTSADSETRFRAGEIARELAGRRFADLQRLAPNSAAVHELAGRQFESLGKLPEALREYRMAIAGEPSRPGLHFDAGNVLWRMRDLDAAETELRAELARTPHHGLANLRLGQVLMARSDEQSAVPLLERALQAMPASIETRRELGKAYRKLHRPTDARVQWEAVAKARPADDQVHYLLANLYRELGEQGLAAREMAIHREILGKRVKRD
jgi:predicted Zn-dependent protease